MLTPDDGYVIVDANSGAGYVLYPNLEAIRALADEVLESSEPSATP